MTVKIDRKVGREREVGIKSAPLLRPQPIQSAMYARVNLVNLHCFGVSCLVLKILALFPI